MNTILWRFLLSTALCRFILVIEIAGMRDKKTADSDSTHETGNVKSVPVAVKDTPASGE